MKGRERAKDRVFRAPPIKLPDPHPPRKQAAKTGSGIRIDQLVGEIRELLCLSEGFRIGAKCRCDVAFSWSDSNADKARTTEKVDGLATRLSLV